MQLVAAILPAHEREVSPDVELRVQPMGAARGVCLLLEEVVVDGVARQYAAVGLSLAKQGVFLQDRLQIDAKDRILLQDLKSVRGV